MDRRHRFDLIGRVRTSKESRAKQIRVEVCALRPLEYYRKHSPWVRVETDNWGRPPLATSPSVEWGVRERLNRAARTIQFMDHHGVIASQRQSPLASLVGKRHFSRQGVGSWHSVYDEFMGPGTGFDHTNTWRRPGERWPCMVTTEPYGLEPGVLESMQRLAETCGLKFQVHPEVGMWNPPSTSLVIWTSA